MIPLIVEASVRIVVIAAAVGLILAIARARAGGVRHAAWSGVVLTMLASPMLTMWRPSLPVEMPRLVTVSDFGDALAVESPLPTDRTESLATEPSTRRTAPALTTARTVPPLTTPQPVVPWAFIAAVAWALGFLANVSHLVAGWPLSRRLAASCTPVASLTTTAGVEINESPLVAAPITVGVLRPRIVLPMSWTTWANEALTAVLAHEVAHVRRRDTLVSLVARFNRCVFWFHPLAWWLERAVTRTAEEACDDVVVRKMGLTQRYAELLVTLAEAVRGHGGRVEWQGVGIGSGRLESRIDRVLRGDGLRRVSRARIAAVAVGCAAAITIGVACQQQPRALEPDPAETARRAAEAVRGQRWKSAVGMTREQVVALEAKVTANPDDLEGTEDLLNFYLLSGQKMFGWNEMVARRLPHLLRVIERHPETNLAHRTLVQAHDPAGYAAAKAAWLTHTSKPGVTAAVLGNAAEFFRASDKPQSEALLLRARDLDPDGPQPRVVGRLYYPTWTSRLGSLYAQALVGANDSTLGNVVRGFSIEESRGAFATSVRRKLDETTDADLLFSAAQDLMRDARSLAGKLDFDHVALGRSYMERVVQLNPGDERARRSLFLDDLARRHERLQSLIDNSRVPVDQFLASLPEPERFEMLADRSDAGFIFRVRSAGLGAQPTESERSSESTRYARQALALAEKFKTHRDYSTVVFNAHIALGNAELKAGNRRAAVQHLRAAGRVPSSELLQALPPWSHMRLVNDLLSAGERESVIEFYERLAELNIAGRERWLKDAQAIREGRMTMSYQHAFGNRSN